MNAENYLRILESNCSLNYVVPTPPPIISNFYWKNDIENKFKAFIPTQDRIVYYNLEEYDGLMTIGQIDDYGIVYTWKYAKKCVLLAVSNTYTEDQQFIQQMESIIDHFAAKQGHSTENVTELSDRQDEPYEHMNRHYVITKYLVNKIINVPVKNRGRYAEFKDTLTITSGHENANIIDAINTAFELAAKRFVDDLDCKVYSYPAPGN